MQVCKLFVEACGLICRPFVRLEQVSKANALFIEYGTRFQQLYGDYACTPNMHMHCHLEKCILDVGPIYSFWCFSFERYNGILEKMRKSWKSPEAQFIRKFVHFQELQHINVNKVIDDDLLTATAFVKSMTSPEEPLSTPDGLFVANNDNNLFCLPSSLSALQASYQKPVLPGEEKFFSEPTYTWLQQVYDKIYPDDEIEFVPRQYIEYKQIEVFSELFTSYKAGKNKSSNVAAIWKIPGGIIQTIQAGISDIRVGQVQYFFTHALQLIG